MRNWKRLSVVFCNRRISARRKGKVFKVAVRPAMTNRAETWNIKVEEKKLDVAKMKMLRWACGHIRTDKLKKTEKSGKE